MTKRNERTSPPVAGGAGKWLRDLSRASELHIRMVDKNGNAYGVQLLKGDALRAFIAPFASALSQAPDKPKMVRFRIPSAVGKTEYVVDRVNEAIARSKSKTAKRRAR